MGACCGGGSHMSGRDAERLDRNESGGRGGCCGGAHAGGGDPCCKDRGRHAREARATESGTLAGVRAGDRSRITEIGDAHTRAQALRFGIGEGAVIDCVAAMPSGPVVVAIGRQEVAIGRGLARRIGVASAGVC